MGPKGAPVQGEATTARRERGSWAADCPAKTEVEDRGERERRGGRETSDAVFIRSLEFVVFSLAGQTYINTRL